MKDKKHFLDPHHHLQQPPSSPFSPAPNSTTDGPTIELPRRRRGRPPGSKNKPKPPSSSSAVSLSPSPSSVSPIPTNPILHPSMRTLLLQIDPDNDVIDSVTRFCRNKSISLSLLSASGTLSHLTLHHPSSPPSALTFRGRFDILSLSATIVSESNPSGNNNINNNNSASVPSSFYLPSGFAVTVSGPQGQVVGGAVGGPLIAAGPVFVVAASFDKPSYHRLPEIEEDEVEGEVAGSGGGGFGCHIGSGGSDVVWAPVAARPPY